MDRVIVNNGTVALVSDRPIITIGLNFNIFYMGGIMIWNGFKLACGFFFMCPWYDRHDS